MEMGKDVKELTSLSDAELRSEADKAWSRGETERLAAIKAEKARRAKLAPKGMNAWVKGACYVLAYLVASNAAAMLGIPSLLAMLLGAAVSGTVTPYIESLVEKAQLRKAQRSLPPDASPPSGPGSR
jgi:hypothetical protein